MNQPEALRLADRLESNFIRTQVELEAAAELRRLVAENKLLHQRHHDDNVEYMRVLAQRDELLEALKEIVEASDSDEWNAVSTMKARAAIAKAEENT